MEGTHNHLRNVIQISLIHCFVNIMMKRFTVVFEYGLCHVLNL